MQVEKLEDICEIASGGTPKRSEDSYWKNGKIPWLKISDIKSKYVDKSEEHITQKGLDNSSAKLFKKGTIIYTIFATVGEVAILNIDATTNQAIAGLTIKDSAQINPSYLFYFLKSIKKQMHLLSRGVAQNNINLSVLRQIKVPIPDLNVQERIVNALDQMQNNIKLRQMELSKLDILIKARFVEMFGDPLRNDRTWPISKLKLLTTKIGSGATPKGGKQSYKKEGITLVRSMNVHDGEFVYKDLAYIDTAQAHDLDNVELQPKDVFINITGASVARSCVIPDNILPGRVNQHVAIIRCKENLLNYIFLNRLFLNSSFKQKLLAMGQAGGATRQALTQEQLKKLNLILPPIELQNEFASFVQQVDKSKVVNASIMKYIISIRFYLYFKENKEGAR